MSDNFQPEIKYRWDIYMKIPHWTGQCGESESFRVMLLVIRYDNEQTWSTKHNPTKICSCRWKTINQRHEKDNFITRLIRNWWSKQTSHLRRTCPFHTCGHFDIRCRWTVDHRFVYGARSVYIFKIRRNITQQTLILEDTNTTIQIEAMENNVSSSNGLAPCVQYLNIQNI